MSVRSPSSFVSLDQRDFETKLPIRSSPLDDLLDNHEFYLDSDQLEVSLCDYRIASTVLSPTVVYRFYIQIKDVCGTWRDGSQLVGRWSARVWSATAVNVSCQIVSYDMDGSQIDDEVAIVNTTTAAWCALGSISLKTNGETNLITVSLEPASANTAYIGGLYIYV